MKTLRAQLKFDFYRVIGRNRSFQFFSIMMPAALYLLFTRILVSGSARELAAFKLQYMCSMIVYSGMLIALMGIAELIMRDRDRGFTRWLQLTPAGIAPYYVSIGLLSLLMNVIAVVVLGLTATVFNGVRLSAGQWLLVGGWAIIGQLPIILLGVLLSFIDRAETLSIVGNLITFPMAILSGLWWPIKMLPAWIRPVGELMPTYFVNDLLGRIVTNGTLRLTNFFGTVIWIGGLLALVVVVTRYRVKRGDGVAQS